MADPFDAEPMTLGEILMSMAPGIGPEDWPRRWGREDWPRRWWRAEGERLKALPPKPFFGWDGQLNDVGRYGLPGYAYGQDAVRAYHEGRPGAAAGNAAGAITELALPWLVKGAPRTSPILCIRLCRRSRLRYS